MIRRTDRRQFVFSGFAGVFGLVTGSAAGSGLTHRPASSYGSDAEPARLVELGLNALARAHSKSYFADGHRGAAFIAAHLMCADSEVPDLARLRIEALLTRNWSHTPLCDQFPEGQANPGLVKQIGDALCEARGSLREVGHNAIFAMHAVRGLQLRPELATAQRVAGICRLIQAIKPWRDDVPIDEAVNPPPFQNSKETAAFVLGEVCAAIDKWKGRGQGYAGHMLTFGHALIVLAENGEEEAAESCREAFRRYVTITRNGPTPLDREIAEHQPSQLRPKTAEYWQERGDKQIGIGHVFKYPSSYYDLVRRANSQTLTQELEARIWRLF